MGACCTCIVNLFKNNKDYGEVNTDPRDVLVRQKSKLSFNNHKLVEFKILLSNLLILKTFRRVGLALIFLFLEFFFKFKSI